MYEEYIFFTRLISSIRLGVKGQAAKGWKHAVWNMSYSLITSNLNEVLSLSKSQKII